MQAIKQSKMLVAVDLVILTIQNDNLAVLVIKRGVEPYLGRWALPGGFVLSGESLEQAAQRELKEETGLTAIKVGHIEQLATYGSPERDPRERVISVAYLAFIPHLPTPKAGGDAADACVLGVDRILSNHTKLAFDHHDILVAGIERARAKLEYTPLAATFCEKEFTINQLRHVYDCVWNTKLDPANFHRKVTKTEGFVKATDSITSGDSGRPAQLFTKSYAKLLHPPLMRPASNV
jgi:8-oxo-dGTP diphosphatase